MLIELFTVNNSYLPLIKIFTVSKLFTVKRYYLSLMEKFTVNYYKNYYRLIISG